MRLAAIVAASRNGVIGRNGQLPWRLPTDLKRFRARTMGKPVVMGRRTFEETGKALDGRLNVILSRRGGELPGCVVVPSLEAALALPPVASAPEVMLLGGGEVFRQYLPFCDALYLTRVEVEVDGDTTFAFDPTEWTEVRREHVPADDRNKYAMTFIDYERRPCTPV